MSPACSSPDVRLHDRSSLAGLIPEWEALAAAAAEPNPFYEHWALVPALDTYVAEADFRCAAVRIGGALVALFPFERVRRYRGLPAGALRSWRHRHMLLCTPLVRSGSERAAFAALLEWAARAGQASIVEFDWLGADGPVRAGLVAALEDAGRAWHVRASFARALLTRAPDADAYLAAALDGERRRELRRKERRLKDAGAARYVRLGRDGDPARWLEDLLRLEACGWKGKAGGALACREPDLQFARRLFDGARARGRLFGVGVDLDGAAIARELCLTAGEGAFSFRIAYDELCSRFAPGLLAALENIRAFHEAPALQWMDSFTGHENTTIGKLWTDRRRIERLTAAVDAWGAFALSLPRLLRWARDQVRLAQRGAVASLGT